MFSFVAGYLGGQRALAKAAAASASAEGIASSLAHDRVAELSERVDRMALLIEAMWELMDDRSEQDLEAMIDEIVSRRAAAITVCAECGSRVTTGPRCQICGAATGTEPPALEGL